MYLFVYLFICLFVWLFFIYFYKLFLFIYSRMRSKGFPFIICGSGSWTLVRHQLVVATLFATFFAPFFASFFASLIPCLWGKLQNLVRFAAQTSPCLCGKLQNLRLCLSCGVAVSMGEAAKHQSLLLRWRRRVYGGSCKTSVSACPAASPCLWGKLQNLVLEPVCASFVVHSSTGTCLCKLCSTQ